MWDIKSVDLFVDMRLEEGGGRGIQGFNSLISLPYWNQVIRLGIEN
jgi:hypothetical protein